MTRRYIPKRQRPNLREQGYEAVAEVVHERLQHGARGRTQWCFVTDTGDLYLREPCDHRARPISLSAWVGTYTRKTLVHDIEDDLILRLRELTPSRLEE